MWLQLTGRDQSELADMVDYSREFVNQAINNRVPIPDNLRYKLCKVTKFKYQRLFPYIVKPDDRISYAGEVVWDNRVYSLDEFKKTIANYLNRILMKLLDPVKITRRANKLLDKIDSK